MAEFQQNLWAPWRMEYVAGLDERDDGCFLCRSAVPSPNDERDLVLWRGPRTLVIMNRFPYTSGHVLIAPLPHTAEFEQLEDEVLLEMMQQARDAKRAIQHGLKADGFNVGMNIARCAGAGLPGHLHLHVVPRWAGDVNFMAVLGDVKVIPQALTASRQAILDAAQALGLGPAATP
jgi:ATP adenylyltransferase